VAVGLLDSYRAAHSNSEFARARVAELEGQLHDKGSEVGALKLTLRNVDAGRIAAEARVAELEAENGRLRAALESIRDEGCGQYDAYTPGCDGDCVTIARAALGEPTT
jgi:hypothetical protein